MIGEGPAARSIKLDLPPFTLAGATTRAGMLTNPLRETASGIVRAAWILTARTSWRRSCAASARLLQVSLNDDGAVEIACRSRGTPRVANRMLRRVGTTSR